jgi:hypothetical protein
VPRCCETLTGNNTILFVDDSSDMKILVGVDATDHAASYHLLAKFHCNFPGSMLTRAVLSTDSNVTECQALLGSHADLAALPDEPDVLQRMLREVVPELQAENEKLWLLIQRLLRHRYGPRSEKLDLEQLQLVLEETEQSAAEAEAAADAAASPQRRRRAAPAQRNRGALPAHLPRYEVVIDIEAKDCPCCGGALQVIGEDRTEQLDLVSVHGSLLHVVSATESRSW